MKPSSIERSIRIYIYTILLGTLLTSIILALLMGNILAFLSFFIFGTITTGLLSIPNIIIINYGLKFIYSNAYQFSKRYTYLFFLWLICNVIPLLIFFIFLDSRIIYSIDDILVFIALSTIYILASLYFIFMVNRNADKKHPPVFADDERIYDEEILDNDL